MVHLGGEKSESKKKQVWNFGGIKRSQKTKREVKIWEGVKKTNILERKRIQGRKTEGEREGGYCGKRAEGCLLKATKGPNRD